MKQRSGSSSLSALKLKSFSSLVKWWAAHYTRHMKGHVSLRDLYGLCVNARTDSGKSLAVWMQQIWRSGNKCRNTLPVYFPESLCERGLWLTCAFIVLSVLFDLVWSTRYSRCFLSASLALSCLVLIKDYYLSLRPRLRVLVPPCYVHRDKVLFCSRK